MIFFIGFEGPASWEESRNYYSLPYLKNFYKFGEWGIFHKDNNMNLWYPFVPHGLTSFVATK